MSDEKNELLCYCGSMVTIVSKQVMWNKKPHKCYHVDPTQKYCRCELCGQMTSMLGTKRCDRCWELESRMHFDPELARKIMEAM